MLIHQKIRENITALLSQSIDETDNIYASRPLFLDLDQEKCVIAVFIDDITIEELTLCHLQYEASLNIAIYLKTHEGESEVDSLAEQIMQCLRKAVEDKLLIDELETINLVEYSCEQDQTNRTWFAANVRYAITYEKED